MKCKRTLLFRDHTPKQKVSYVLFTCLMFLFFSVTPLQAKVQKFSLSLKDVTLKEALNQIEKVSGYSFIYNNSLVDINRQITIIVNNMSLEEILDKLFKKSSTTYQIADKQIILAPKDLQKNQVKESGQKNDSQSEKKSPSLNIVSGKVLDSENYPMPGASILIKGTNQGTFSKDDGTFSLSIPQDKQYLVFSFIGMKTQEIDVRNKNFITIKMKDNINSLADVVVTGYQSISRERATGSFSKLTAESIETQRLDNLNTLLEGRVAGFQDGLLRGTTSMNGMTTPLYVIDGFPVENTRFTSTGNQEEQLPDLNLEDIESITVLKDAAATSIYGARAANGVVVIVTKKAKKGKTNVSFSSTLTFSPYKYYTDNLTDAREIINMEREWADGNPILQATDGTASTNAASLLDNAVYSSQGIQSILNYYAGNISESEMNSRLNSLANMGYQYYNDIEKYAKRNPFDQQYNLSLGKSTDQNNFNASVTYRNNKYEDINSKAQSVGINMRNSTEISKWLTIDLGTYIYYKKGNEQSYDALNPGFSYQPYNRLINSDGSPFTSTAASRYNKSTLSNIDKYGLYSMDITPLDELKMNIKKSKNFSNRSYTKLNFKITDWLKYSVMFQYEYAVDRMNQLKNKESYAVRSLVNGMATISSSGKAQFNLPYGDFFYTREQFSNAYNFRQQVDFSKTFNERHQLTVIAGTEARHSKLEYKDNTLYGYDPDMLSFTPVDQNTLINTSGITGGNMTSNDFAVKHESTRRFVSVYGNTGYTFDDKYTATGSLRWDRSDLWGTDNKYQNKPIWSLGASWNISKEKFFQTSWVDMLKLRFSYGIGGNIVKDAAPYMTAHYNTSSTVGGTYGYIQSRPNPELSWEKTTTANLGIDFSILFQRISGSLEIYNKLGTDLLANTMGIPTEGWGYSTYKINNGEMRNRGLEVTLNTAIIRHKNFGWNANLLYGYNKNKVTYVNVKAPVYYLQLDYSSAYPRIGTSYNSIYGYKWAGLSSSGLPQVYDAEGNAVTYNPANLDAIEDYGTTVPIHSGSLGTSFKYKNFELSMLFIYQLGHKIRNNMLPMLNNSYSWALGGYKTNIDVVNKRIKDRWKQPGDETKTNVPRVVYEYESDYSYDSYSIYSYADINILDASNIRLSNVSLAYQVPSAFCSRLRLQNVRLNFNVENIFTLTKSKDAKYLLGGFESPNYVCGISVNF
jgi:TonB-linked SusC/RagA family outer membrane protein